MGSEWQKKPFVCLQIPARTADKRVDPSLSGSKDAALSTIHSAKGLDYSVVFLLGLDYLVPKENGWTEEQIINLAYVGITRARYQLIIPYINDGGIIGRFKECL